jgi:hypothetical protein
MGTELDRRRSCNTLSALSGIDLATAGDGLVEVIIADSPGDVDVSVGDGVLEPLVSLAAIFWYSASSISNAASILSSMGAVEVSGTTIGPADE